MLISGLRAIKGDMVKTQSKRFHVLYINPMVPGQSATQLGHIPGDRSKAGNFSTGKVAILHLCVAIAMCSSHHVMSPFLD